MQVSPHRQDTLDPSGDRPPVSYDRAPTFSGLIAEKDVAVPMRDGVNLSVDVYRPDDGGKFPALLAFSIYNKDLQGPDVAAALPPQPAWSSLWAGLLEAGDTKFFVVARLCPRHRLAARRRQVRQRRLAAMGQLRSDRMDRATAVVRRQCRHGRDFRFRRRAAVRRAAKPAAPESDLPARSARRLRHDGQLPRGISRRRAASVPLFDHAFRRHPRRQGQSRARCRRTRKPCGRRR